MCNDTERALRRRPISNNAHTDWLKKLAEIPALPATGEGEWYHTVDSGWMHGISVNDRPQDSNTHLMLTRAANNERGFGKPILSYDVFFQWGAGRDYGNMTMDPEAAIYFGQHLIEAGSTALQDQARHATWVVGTPSTVAVEVPDKVRTPAESVPLVDPGTGRRVPRRRRPAGDAAAGRRPDRRLDASNGGLRRRGREAHRDGGASVTERFWEAPRPPHAPIPDKWDELPDDPAHPTIDDCERRFLERHFHQLCHDGNDELEWIAATAVYQSGLGTRIEFGPWSLLAQDARALADSLRILADECDAIDGPNRR